VTKGTPRLLLGLFACLVTMSSVLGSPRSRAVNSTPSTPIRHVVFILKENRSFDSYFGQFPGANGATTGKMSDGTVIDLTQHPTPEPLNHDIRHNYADFRVAYDHGANDGFDLEQNAIYHGVNNAYTQMREGQIPNYWQYARTYGLGDNTFSDYRGNSFGNNLFSIAAQSGRYDPTLHFRGVNGIPQPPRGESLNTWWGCDDPVGTTVKLLGSDGSRSSAFPCFSFEALPNKLAAEGISWKVYAPIGQRGNTHNVLGAISSARYDPNLWANDVPLSGFTSDALNGRLPSVSWVVSTQTEHPVQLACDGENESVGYINAIMNGPDWSSTAIFIIWDEWGGFYDHVPPPQPDNYSYGFRVPLLVISPYVRYGPGSNGGYVNTTFFSQSSILKFIEDNWGIDPLTPRDAGSNNMMDFFDFSQVPKPKLILTQHSCPLLSPAQQAAADQSAEED
jgi:phospholipase C